VVIVNSTEIKEGDAAMGGQCVFPEILSPTKFSEVIVKFFGEMIMRVCSRQLVG